MGPQPTNHLVPLTLRTCRSRRRLSSNCRYLSSRPQRPGLSRSRPPQPPLQRRRRHRPLPLLLRLHRPTRRSPNRHFHQRQKPRTGPAPPQGARRTIRPRIRHLARLAGRRPRNPPRPIQRPRNHEALAPSPRQQAHVRTLPPASQRSQQLRRSRLMSRQAQKKSSTKLLKKVFSSGGRGFSPGVKPIDKWALAPEENFSSALPRPINTAKVFLIGAGPGDPELLTIKALRILQSADVVLHDSLIGPEILNLIPPTAERIDVGKRAGFRLLTQQDINSLLLSNVAKHKIVVRLKGGDPLLFGRAAEEIQALREAKIDFEVVPGISAAFGAAAAAKVSLTDRRLSSHVLFTTFSRAPEAKFLPGIGLTADTTVVVYMPGPDYAEVSRWLQDAAVSPDTPVLVISKASHPDQSQHATTVAGLAHQAPLPAPALLLVGRVAASATDATTPGDFNWLNESIPDFSNSRIS